MRIFRSRSRQDDTSVETVVALVLGDATVASSRIRALIPLSKLAADHGTSVKFVTANNGPFWRVRFVYAVLSRPQFTLVQKVVAPRWLCLFARAFSKYLVYELDDAVYLGYPGNQSRAATAAKRVTYLAGKADRVVVSTALIADDLENMSGHRPYVCPGPAPEVWPERDGAARHAVLWLGSPSTYSAIKDLAVGIEQDLRQSSPTLQLVLVGAPIDASDPVATVVWSPQSERQWLGQARVGLLPVETDAWSLRKASYKMLVYLANDMIPVCPDVPHVRNLVGELFEALCVRVPDPGDAAAWSAAVRTATSVPIDENWRRMRNAYFASISTDVYLACLFGNTIGNKESL